MPLTRLPLTTGVSGTLPIGNGGTNVTTSADLANTGNMVLLSTATASSDSSISFDSTYINDDYDTYELHISNMTLSTETGLSMHLSVDGGTTLLNFKRATANVAQSSDANTSFIARNGTDIDFLTGRFNIGNASGENFSSKIFFHNLRSTSLWKTFSSHTAYVNTDGEIALLTASHVITNTSAVNYIKLEPSSGTISGSATLYGVRT